MNFSYRNTLLLLVTCILVETLSAWFLRHNPEAFQRGLWRLLAPSVIFIGILIYSKPARYIGALWLGGASCFTLWAIIQTVITPTSASSAVPFLVRATIFVMTVLEAVACYALVLAKPFSWEFSIRREQASKYIDWLRRSFLLIIGLAILVGIFNDVNRLFLRKHGL